MKSRTLYRVLAVLLVGMAVLLLIGHERVAGAPFLTGAAQMAAGVASGFGIGVVAALMGVAGGELLIPTLIFLFGADIRLAGSLSLAGSLPTMLVGFARYRRDGSFVALRENQRFVLVMAAGSLLGAWIGGHLLSIVPEDALPPLLATILAISSIKVWRHG